MKPKEILKRSYYALTSMLFFFVLLDWTPYNEMLSRRYLCLSFGVFGLLLVLGIAFYCFVMSRHNGKPKWKWFAGAIPITIYALWLIIVEILRAWARNNQEFLNIYVADIIFLFALALCMMIITFCSKTRYDNLLPTQTKRVSQVFRWGFIVLQILVWVRFIYILPAFIWEWSAIPSEAYVIDKFESMNSEFDQVFN